MFGNRFVGATALAHKANRSESASTSGRSDIPLFRFAKKGIQRMTWYRSDFHRDRYEPRKFI